MKIILVSCLSLYSTDVYRPGSEVDEVSSELPESWAWLTEASRRHRVAVLNPAADTAGYSDFPRPARSAAETVCWQDRDEDDRSTHATRRTGNQPATQRTTNIVDCTRAPSAAICFVVYCSKAFTLSNPPLLRLAVNQIAWPLYFSNEIWQRWDTEQNNYYIASVSFPSSAYRSREEQMRSSFRWFSVAASRPICRCSIVAYVAAAEIQDVRLP